VEKRGIHVFPTSLPEFLVSHPDGEIRLRGHRILLDEVVAFFNDGEDAGRLQERYPSLGKALIDAVTSYYEANRPEIDAYVAERAAQAEQLRKTAPPGQNLAEMRRRWDAERQASCERFVLLHRLDEPDARDTALVIDSEAWRRLNTRRAELIHKKNHQSLTAEETAEYGRLQELCYDALEKAFPRPDLPWSRLDRLCERLGEGKASEE
jgi:uncharacterized protein (DUF433 family)